GLVEFANRFRQPSAPGTEIIDTPRYRVVLQPDYPIPGPNSAIWIRCRADEADEVIAEVRAIARERRLPIMWILDPEVEPEDFASRLAGHGVHPDPIAPEVAVMVLSAGAELDTSPSQSVEIRDALAELEKFRGRGVYRAMVAARLEMAREAGAAGISVWGGPMSAPILSKLGFVKVGWRRFYPDLSGPNPSGV